MSLPRPAGHLLWVPSRPSGAPSPQADGDRGVGFLTGRRQDPAVHSGRAGGLLPDGGVPSVCPVTSRRALSGPGGGRPPARVSAPGLWKRIAAAGTDPVLLARVVGRLLGPTGHPRTVAAAAARAGLTGEDPGSCPDDPTPLRWALHEPATEVTAVLERLAPPVDAATAPLIASVARTWTRLGVRAALIGDPSYPRRLARGWPASGAPPLLAWRGPSGGLPDRPTVAIVGARRASGYGTGVAAWLAEASADAGILVVSGGAVGVDGAAHTAALGRSGGTVVMLGCGHAVGYPRQHAAPGGLFDRILGAGGWLASELPPQTPPRPPTVLARNRLVAGLADAVVVVEGGPRSGSLRTATVAAERGIPLLAVPGDVRAPGSAAPHRLLSEGAAPCTGPEDILDVVVGTTSRRDDPAGRPARPTGTVSVLPEPVRRELVRRWPRPVRVDVLAEACGEPVARLLAALTRARIAGEVADGPDGVRVTRPNR